jgi:hypothetical protein
VRKILASMAIAAASLLAACVFESAAPLVPAQDFATPLAAGNYAWMQRQTDGSFTKDADAKLTLENNLYTLTAPDGPMKFALYQVSPKIFIVQVPDKPQSILYLILETTAEGAAITSLQCQQLNAEERARFHLGLDDKDSCVFTNLDDLVVAAMYLKGRGETPSMNLVRQ